MNSNCLFSDFGFKLSEDLSLEVCVPDPEFSGKPYSPPMPCPVGSTYRRTRGYVSDGWLSEAYKGLPGEGGRYEDHVSLPALLGEFILKPQVTDCRWLDSFLN